jgi:hypothetical protein
VDAVKRVVARVQELDDETKRLRGQHVTDLVKVQELERENAGLVADGIEDIRKLAELEREVARLKEAMKGIAQEAHLVSIRLANAAVSPDDLKTMLAKER